jgi:hypothetical protein
LLKVLPKEPKKTPRADVLRRTKEQGISRTSTFAGIRALGQNKQSRGGWSLPSTVPQDIQEELDRPYHAMDQSTRVKEKWRNVKTRAGLRDSNVAPDSPLPKPEEHSTETPKVNRAPGRPKGSIDPEVLKRKQDMLEAWEKGDFDTKADAARAHEFDRANTSRLITEFEAARKRNPKLLPADFLATK